MEEGKKETERQRIQNETGNNKAKSLSHDKDLIVTGLIYLYIHTFCERSHCVVWYKAGHWLNVNDPKYLSKIKKYNAAVCSHLWLSHIMVLSLAPMCLIQTWKPPFSSSAWRSKTSLMHNGPFGVHCWASKVPLWPCLDKRRRGLCAAVHGIVYFMSGSDQFMTEHWSLRRCRWDKAVKCWQAVTEHVHMDGTQKKKTKKRLLSHW